MGSHEICDCRECTAQDQERMNWRWFVACAIVACLMAWLMGCTTVNSQVTIHVTATDHSTISDSGKSAVDTPKSVQASPYLSTTGEAIGQAASAFIGGVNVGDLVKVIQDLRARVDALQGQRQ